MSKSVPATASRPRRAGNCLAGRSDYRLGVVAGGIGHLPVRSRAKLVDSVLDLPELQGSTHLDATVPLGDSE